VASHSPVEIKLSFHHDPQLSGAQFLLFLGSRVRDLRNRRAMTRKALARESDVSERHLAQLESGEGNISILLLHRIAAVLRVSLEELFATTKTLRKDKPSCASSSGSPAIVSKRPPLA
jgi:XRE family transcriptional regulator, aerobic/anaerobic benzoate catabolism transcriptional regulator